jgi:putative hydrolase of the HAD superfamily
MRDISKIKAVVFDFGGVIIDLFPNKTFDELRSQIDPNKEAAVQKLALDVELGNISGTTFINELSALFKSRLDTEDVIEIWNRMLCEIDSRKVDFLNTLKKSYKVYLLSNTNIVHKEFFDITCKNAFGCSLENFFDETFYSHEINLRKPNREIFEYLIKEVKLSPSEILFVDDLSENIESAKSLGIETHLFNRNEKFETLNYLITNH